MTAAGKAPAVFLYNETDRAVIHDCERETHMKKRRILKSTAAGLIASFALTGCVSPQDNINGDVYGPPPTETLDPEENVPVAVYGPPEAETMDPEENVPEDVYGPPAEEDEEPAAEASTAPEFGPGGNVADPLYGPPDVKK